MTNVPMHCNPSDAAKGIEFPRLNRKPVGAAPSFFVYILVFEGDVASLVHIGYAYSSRDDIITVLHPQAPQILGESCLITHVEDLRPRGVPSLYADEP